MKTEKETKLATTTPFTPRVWEWRPLRMDERAYTTHGLVLPAGHALFGRARVRGVRIRAVPH